jgi:hypothetical protein
MPSLTLKVKHSGFFYDRAAFSGHKHTSHSLPPLTVGVLIPQLALPINGAVAPLPTAQAADVAQLDAQRLEFHLNILSKLSLNGCILQHGEALYCGKK